MQAVAVSPVAIAAIYRSDVALSAVDSEVSAAATFYGADSVAMGKAVVILAGLDPDDFADMAAVAASSTAMAAVAASSTAMAAVAASATALDALYAKKKRMSGGSASLSGKFIILEISGDNAFKIGQYGYATLSDGSQPNWDNYKNKYAYFKQFKKYATYMRNDTDGDDWIDYFQVS